MHNQLLKEVALSWQLRGGWEGKVGGAHVKWDFCWNCRARLAWVMVG